MPSTFDPILGLEQQAAGENLSTWGAPKLNNVIGQLAQAVDGYVSYACNGSVTPSSTNGVENQFRYAYHRVTGSGGTVTLPGRPFLKLIRNAASAPITITNGSGSVTLAVQEVALILSTGTDLSKYAPGDVPTPTRDSMPATKRYVDDTAFSNIPGTFPGQSGNAGKALFTDGSTPYWGNVLPVQTGLANYVLTTNGSSPSWVSRNDLYPDQTDAEDMALFSRDGQAVWADIFPDPAGNDGKFLGLIGGSREWVGVPGAQQIDTISASGTWTKPAGAVLCRVICLGGGGGGGGGSAGSSAVDRGGGGGGAGGGYSEATFLASQLGATESVSIGAAGSAGLGAPVVGNNGSAGGSGGTTIFGGSTLLFAKGGAGGAGGIAIGTTVSGGASTSPPGTLWRSGPGGNGRTASGLPASNTDGGTNPSMSPGGGGGGGVDTGGSLGSGGAGAAGCMRTDSATGDGGVSGGGNGVNSGLRPGTGGGGGDGTLSAGGTGGAGGYGAGGGGGGAGRNTGGAGGSGGAGRIWVISTF